MRPRKQTDTIIRQYKYSVSTDLRPMPDFVWDVARRMQGAWNALITAYAGSGLALLNLEYEQLRQHASELCKAIRKERPDISPKELQAQLREVPTYSMRKKRLDESKKQTWWNWDKVARNAIAPFKLDYSQGPNVIERFNGCIKAGRTCTPETELTSVQIPFVFPGSAAIPVSQLYNNNRRWRIVLEGYREDMFANNSKQSQRERRNLYLELGMSKVESIPLRIDFHRELPPDGIVKRVLLCGRKLPFKGYTWHVLFQVEQPILNTPSATKGAVDIRVCWTRIDDSIVAAQWKDEKGNEGILMLPLNMSNHADRNTQKRRPQWEDWVYDYRDLDAFRTAEFALPEGSEARMRMRERRRRVEDRWTARKKWLYRNFATWLIREYALIRIPDINIKAIAEDNSKSGALAGGDHWRQIAAPGMLLETIRDLAQKHGRKTEKIAQNASKHQLLRDQTVTLQTLQNIGVRIYDIAWNRKEVHVGKDV